MMGHSRKITTIASFLVMYYIIVYYSFNFHNQLKHNYRLVSDQRNDLARRFGVLLQ